MFARYFSGIPLPVETVQKAILNDPSGWIPGCAEAASYTGDALLTEFGFEIARDGSRVSKEVAVLLHDPIYFPTRTILPMTWRATSHEALFPVVEADLELAPMGARKTQLSVSARYDPPLGPVGRVIDRALFHRMAEAVVKDFVDRIIEKLLASLRDSGEAAAL